MADQSAGRVSLHPCFPLGLWTASVENTGEGGTPALFTSREKETNRKEYSMNNLQTFVLLSFALLLVGCGQDYTPVCMECLTEEADRNLRIIKETGNFAVDGWDVSNLKIGELRDKYNIGFTADVTYRPVANKRYYLVSEDPIQLERCKYAITEYRWVDLHSNFPEWFDSQTADNLGNRILGALNAKVIKVNLIDLSKSENCACLCYRMNGWCCSDDEGETYHKVDAKVIEIADLDGNKHLCDEDHLRSSATAIYVRSGDKGTIAKFKESCRKARASIEALYDEVTTLDKINRRYRLLTLEAIKNIADNKTPVPEELLRGSTTDEIRVRFKSIATTVESAQKHIKEIFAFKLEQPNL